MWSAIIRSSSRAVCGCWRLADWWCFLPTRSASGWMSRSVSATKCGIFRAKRCRRTLSVTRVFISALRCGLNENCDRDPLYLLPGLGYGWDHVHGQQENAHDYQEALGWGSGGLRALIVGREATNPKGPARSTRAGP